MRILLSLTLVIGLIAATPLIANQADFARGVVLDTADGSVVQRLTLPDDVYEWVLRRDLGDLRVFNREQEEMPYNVRRPAKREEFSAWAPLPLFPLPESEPGQPGAVDLRVHVGESGAIVSYQGGAVDASDARAYLVDASALQQTPTEMKLSWLAAGSGEIVGRIRIESSDDLNSWQTLIAGTTIARLTNAGGEVLLDRFDLPRRQARYLRITQLEGSQPLAIDSVAVRHRRSELPQRRWRTLAGTPVDGGWEFASGGWFPVDHLKLTTSGNFLVTAHLFSRRSEQDDWRDRGVRTFYRSSIAGAIVESEPLRIDDGDRFWRVEFEGEGLRLQSSGSAGCPTRSCSSSRALHLTCSHTVRLT